MGFQTDERKLFHNAMKKIKGVDLDRIDIVYLLTGISPMYGIIDKIPSDLGYFVGGFVDYWEWSPKTYIYESKYTDEQLYDFYLLCKNTYIGFCAECNLNVKP